ncbi:probable galacturonosyltransferase 4, partial [Tanacetum coccineum]
MEVPLNFLVELDQLIRGRVYLSLSATRTNVQFNRELWLRIKEVQKALGDANKDLNLPKNAHEKLTAMDHTLAKGKQIQYDCTTGLHCLPLRLSIEYYSLNSSAQQFSNQEKVEDPKLFHYALFLDNVLATAVVVNSTITNAK